MDLDETRFHQIYSELRSGIITFKQALQMIDDEFILSETADDLRSQVESLESDVEDLNNQIRDLEDDLDDAKDEIRDLKKDIEILEKGNDA
jgi:peptidoglycan hydrolase CwlO-like protein